MFTQLLNMSISASWVVLAVIALRLVLKKAPKAIHCALWVLVAVRLVCPVTIESDYSLMAPEKSEAAASKMMDDYVGSTNIYWDITSEYDMALDAGMVPIRAEGSGSYVVTGTTPFTEPTRLADVMESVWAMGVIAIGLYALISYLAVWRKVRVCMALDKTVRLCDHIDTPFILGIIRPKIYLPSELDPMTAGHVLAHEQAHLKRRDHWWKPLGFALLSVYWFSPLLWLAYVLLCRDIEQACDEKVVQALDTDGKKAYSMALLECSMPRRMITACPLAFGEVGVKSRIKSVLSYKKPAFWVILVAILASIAAAVCFLTDPKDSGPSAYDVTSDLWIYDAEHVEVTVWDEGGSHGVNLSEEQIQDLCKIINELRAAEFIKEKPKKHLLYAVLHCKDFDIDLHWDGEYAYFTFDPATEDGITSNRRSVKNEELNEFLNEIMEMEYRLAEGTYAPINAASLYSEAPDGLDLIENRRYEVTKDGLTVSDLGSGDAIAYVFDWCWEGYKEAQENLSDFVSVSEEPSLVGIHLRMHDPALKYQHLYDNTHMVFQNGSLFLIEGRTDRENKVTDWTVYELEEYSPYLLPPATYTEFFENAGNYIHNALAFARSGDRRPGFFSLTVDELETLHAILEQMPEDAIQPGDEMKDRCITLSIWNELSSELQCNAYFWYYAGEAGMYWSSYETEEIKYYQVDYAPLTEFLAGLMQPERIEIYSVMVDVGHPTYVSYTHGDVTISLVKVIGWDYEIVPYVDARTDFGIRCKPEWMEDWLFFGYMQEHLEPDSTFLHEATVNWSFLNDDWHYLFENPIEGTVQWPEWPEPWKMIYCYADGGTYYIYNEGAFDERLPEHDRGGYNYIEDSFSFCLTDEETIIAQSENHIYPPDYENPEVRYESEIGSYYVTWHKKDSDGYTLVQINSMGIGIVTEIAGTESE